MSYPSVAFKFSSPVVGLQPIAETSSTQKHRVGMVATAFDATYGEGEFIYLVGVASTASGDVCAYDSSTGATVRGVIAGTGSSGPCGVAMSDNVASQYGWYQVRGSGPVSAAVAAANTAAYLSATAGQVDDSTSTGNRIDGLLIKGVTSGGFATCQLNAPTIVGTSGESQSVTAGAPTTAATATGTTVSMSGEQRAGSYKVTVDKAAWTTAGTTQDITLAVLPAKSRITYVYADTTIKYAGPAGTLAIKVGTSAGGSELLVSHDVKTATILAGALEADLGTAMVITAVVQGVYLPSFTGATTITVRLTSGTGNIGAAGVTNLTTGSTTFYIGFENL